METKKSSKGLIVLVVILSVLLLGALSHICYNKLHEEKPEIEKPIVEEPKKYSEEEINKILSTVPHKRESQNNNVISAYNTNGLTIEEASNDLLLIMALEDAYSTNNFLSYKKGMPLYQYDNADEPIELPSYIKTEYITNFILKQYNKQVKNIKNVKAHFNGELFVDIDSDYVGSIGAGGSSFYKKINSNIDYKVENNKLVISEKVAFIVFLDEYGGVEAVSKTEDTDKNKVKEIKLNLDDYEKSLENSDKELKKYFEDHIDEFYTYKHTFNIENNNIYWQSTVVEK